LDGFEEERVNPRPGFGFVGWPDWDVAQGKLSPLVIF
jgi:hypothetical protein